MQNPCRSTCSSIIEDPISYYSRKKNRCLPNEYFEHEDADSNKYQEFGFGGVEIHLKLLINRSSFNANNSEN